MNLAGVCFEAWITPYVSVFATQGVPWSIPNWDVFLSPHNAILHVLLVSSTNLLKNTLTNQKPWILEFMLHQCSEFRCIFQTSSWFHSLIKTTFPRVWQAVELLLTTSETFTQSCWKAVSVPRVRIHQSQRLSLLPPPLTTTSDTIPPFREAKSPFPATAGSAGAGCFCKSSDAFSEHHCKGHICYWWQHEQKKL